MICMKKKAGSLHPDEPLLIDYANEINDSLPIE